ncbi:hypothetical protein PHISCL_04963 [Aspergillus sclerotialis]|uniref:Histone-lysine N-methyltransferase, H3 lysine-79 specific n=1 Tax=Aspergillus sclerotialis TaxID=2070753 RepID=A0A3A2ZHW4_9EURO|nr:hypothetical protein PHISCL_04963 [Aspergillus sclerotialis]
MGFFDHLQKGGGSFTLQPKKPQIRKVAQSRSTPSSASNTPERAPSRSYPSSEKRKNGRAWESRSASRDHERRTPSNRVTPSRKRQTPEQRLSSDDEDGTSDTDTSFDMRKRARTGDSAEPDPDRRIRSVKAFSEEDATEFPMVHAADITSVQKAGKFMPAFEGTENSEDVFLQYPSASQKERYNLVIPRDHDDFRPIDDIVQVVEIISQNYVPEDEADEFNNDSSGIKRRLRRALAHMSETEFRETVADHNRAIERLRLSGSIAKKLDASTRLSLPLVERILTQIYSRTVSPRVESLRQYENGSDNVYGELLPRFISTIFKETRLKSGQVFVDLGSGVGNVVLQAALEIGCESWGCEMMENACDLAELQQAEFKARCRLWGIAPGETHLVRGDFLKEQSISDVLKRADVILINNQAFTPQLNTELINHFLDMKEGCQIVSLKSFVPAGHKIQSRNINSPLNLLTVKQKNYWSNSVSWTDVGGTYFIATKDGSRLKAFTENELGLSD